MNLKDCIHIIKNCTMLACEYHIKDKCDYTYEVRENRFECAKEQAIKALEKQISKKPKLVKRANGIIKFYPCPCCSTSEEYTTVYPKQKYCTECGQKLEW